MKSYSQHGEDIWILENLKPPVGTFCEVGAFDGVLSSNTLMFEELGWTGLLVEADPFLANLCISNRRALTWCCASGMATHGAFYVNREDRGLSGLKRKGNPIQVLIKHLDWLLEYQHVNLLSIDTEGTELDVWESIGGIRPDIVIMEYRTCDEPAQDKAIVDRMVNDGYHEVHRTLCNIIFTR